MKQITIIAHTGSNLGSIDNPRRAFLFVNKYLRQKGEQPLFKVQIAGYEKEILLKNGLCTLHADVAIKNLQRTDLILIPALDGDIKKGVEATKPFIPWIVDQHNKGAEIASLCVGAFSLAATGLLDGRKCSTHWRAADDFKKMFPDVELITDKVITDEQGIYTSGGAFSSANLILYIIEKYAGREAAVRCAKMFQVDIDRQSQSPFIIFEGQKSHEDEKVRQAQEFIESNYQDKILVKHLAENVAMSRRTLERRFKKATYHTVKGYIQRVKVEAAKRDLEMGRKNVGEVMYKVGYSDTKSFRNLFRRITGLTPIDYRNKYSNETLMA